MQKYKNILNMGKKIHTATSFDRMTFYLNFVFFIDNVYINNKKKTKTKGENITYNVYNIMKYLEHVEIL